MRRLLPLAAAIAVAASGAAASPCGKVAAPKAEAVSSFEQAFLDRNWTAARKMLPFFDAASKDELFAGIESSPVRFTRCEVMFAEALPPLVHRRALVFYDGDEPMLFLYLDMVVLSGRTEIGYISYDGRMTPILELIR